jgi:hypothetical protein
MRERTLAAGRGGLGQVGIETARRQLARLPDRDLDAGLRQPLGELATDRDLDPDQIDAGSDEVRRLLERGRDIRLAQGDPEPRPIGLAEHVDRLATDGALRIDPLDRQPCQPRRLDLRDRPPVALAQELALEGQVDRARGDVERQLLRLEVVFEQGHRERQGDARREPARIGRQPAVDRRPRQRPPARVEPGDAEEAQDRPLLAGRRRATRPGTPGTGQRVGARDEPVDRDPSRHSPSACSHRRANHATHHASSAGPVRAWWPIQTWPSTNRSAFQIGARALVSSIA